MRSLRKEVRKMKACHGCRVSACECFISETKHQI